MFLQLINGVALLLALCLLQAINARLLRGKGMTEKLVSGVLFGAICVIGMMVPITIAPGAIFDARSVILSMAGLFGGPLTALIAATIASAYRWHLGGVGAFIGISVILSSTVLGLVYRYARSKAWIGVGVVPLFLFGLVVHALAVAHFALFPQSIALDVMTNLALPFVLVFALATVFLGMLLTGIDDLVETERDLLESEKRYRQQSQRLEEVIWGTDVGTWEWNIQTDEATVNDRWLQMFGYAREELVHICGGKLTRSALGQLLVHPEIRQEVEERMDRCFRRESEIFECEERVNHKSGEPIWFLARGRVVEWSKDGQPLRMSGTHQDITARKLAEQKLQHIAHYDLLTNLPNRVLFAERLQYAMAQAQRRSDALAVAYLDLDGFKEVNDRYGHDVGDRMLSVLAERLKASLREVDTLSRIGGDEFAAVLVDLQRAQDCLPVIDRLLQAAAEPVTFGKAILRVSASVGVTFYPQDIADADQLLRQADQAMYIAKQLGKNRYHLFDVEQAAGIVAHRELLARLQQALHQHEFVLLYQPKVNMKTGELIGAEALIRWAHPDKGLLPPATFLPPIENHVLGMDLGDWVIETALAQMAAWLSVGINIPVSVNVGAYQLQQQDFASRLSGLLLAQPTVPPQSLELEILETSALEDIANVSAVMTACRALGVRFALDDFGTGYSSLTYLKRLPAEVLKIDQTFVRDILDDPDDLAIVEGVMGLANAFRRHAIAEGVETEAHGELLLSLGCELAQGYAIARPMPAGELPGWAAGWRPAESWKAMGDGPMDRNKRMVIYAEVKHRQWVRSLESFLTGGRDAPPSLDTHLGSFDNWLEGYGMEHYGSRPEFRFATNLHRQLHEVGRQLVERHLEGKEIEAGAYVGELHALCEELVTNLRKLVQD